MRRPRLHQRLDDMRSDAGGGGGCPTGRNGDTPADTGVSGAAIALLLPSFEALSSMIKRLCSATCSSCTSLDSRSTSFSKRTNSFRITRAFRNAITISATSAIPKLIAIMRWGSFTVQLLKAKSSAHYVATPRPKADALHQLTCHGRLSNSIASGD
jgi:hypothetical protein